MPRFLPCEKCGKPSTDGHLRKGLCKRCDATARLLFGYESSYTDAQPTREHITRLRDKGMGLRRIAELSGCSRSILQCLMNGKTRDGRREPPSARISKHNEARILAIPVPERHELHHAVADSAPVPAIGTVRRMQALHAFGYTLTYLAEQVGWEVGNAQRLYADDTAQVTAATARKVDALFSRLQMTPPPDTFGSRRAKERGEAKGWKLPLFWDEDSIDAELVDDFYVQDARADRRTKVHFAVTYAELVNLGYRDIDIARRMGIKPESLDRQKDRWAKRIALELTEEGIAL